jgi:hypothetical protein
VPPQNTCTRADYELRGVESGSGRRIRKREQSGRSATDRRETDACRLRTPVRGQTTSYAEWRAGLGGGSGSASGAVDTSSGTCGDRIAIVANATWTTGALVVMQDETPHGPSHIAPIAMQLSEAIASGADSAHRRTAITATAVRQARMTPTL